LHCAPTDCLVFEQSSCLKPSPPSNQPRKSPIASSLLSARNVVVSRKTRSSTAATTNVKVLTNEPLRVSLNDLLQSDTRGKWWLVGAGWQGNPLLEVKPVEKQEDSLMEMAREQGMNTDVRRSIFVILMTSEVCRLARCPARFKLISRTLSMRAIG